MEDTQEHVGRLEAQLKQWGARLDQVVSFKTGVATAWTDLGAALES